MIATQLHLDDIQGDILRAYGNDYDCTSYVFVRVAGTPAQGRTWLAGLLAGVTPASPWTSGKPPTTLNVALTAGGLAALGVPADTLATFSHEFRAGMAARAEGVLGDSGPSAPSAWEPGFGDAHALLVSNARTPEEQEAALAALRAEIEAADGVEIATEQHAQLLPGAREHFGFADGFAQPAVMGSSEERARGGGTPERGGRWRALAPGEFILGHPDEDTLADRRHRLPAAPADPLGSNGTYMVWRKLHQDVALWRRTIRAAAKRWEDGDERRLAAKVVGRWQDGAPLVTHPDDPGSGFDPAAPGANDFRYGDDLAGMRCPVGAHIRRSNPRDALGNEGKLSMRHRMIRRGMPYGPPLPEGVRKDDGEERGLVFVSYQASIARQFEGVQGPWLGDGNIFGLGHDRDYLLGDATGGGKMTIQGRKPFLLAPQQQLVTTRGGAYLFVPGMTALRALAAGEVA